MAVGAPLLLNQSAQALSGAGAVDVTSQVTLVTSTGASQAITLADGTVGQVKTIIKVVDGGSSVLTPANFNGGTTITFDAVGDAATLIFFNSNWNIIGSNSVTIG